MFDGQIEQPVHLLLLLLAAVIGAPTAWLALRRPGKSDDRFGAAAVVAVLALVPLNVLHVWREEGLVWLFGSETQDIGPVEWLTAAGFLLSASLAWKLSARLLRGRPVIALLFACFGAAAVLVSLEEVSWGQHLFGFSPPPEIAAANLQHESNLHNFIAAPLLDPVYAAVGGLLIAAALLLHFAPRLLTPARDFALSLARTRYAVPLLLLTGALLQHEAFEELAELSAAALLVHALAAFVRDLPRGNAVRPGLLATG